MEKTSGFRGEATWYEFFGVWCTILAGTHFCVTGIKRVWLEETKHLYESKDPQKVEEKDVKMKTMSKKWWSSKSELEANVAELEAKIAELKAE